MKNNIFKVVLWLRLHQKWDLQPRIFKVKADGTVKKVNTALEFAARKKERKGVELGKGKLESTSIPKISQHHI